MTRRRYTQGSKGRKRKPVSTPEEAAAFIRKYAIGLFDREDGREADWTLIAETLFHAAFAALDEPGVNSRTRSVLRRIHADAYDRLANSDGILAGLPI